MPPKTMFEEIWDADVMHAEPGEATILYVDLQLLHDVTPEEAG